MENLFTVISSNFFKFAKVISSLYCSVSYTVPNSIFFHRLVTLSQVKNIKPLIDIITSPFLYVLKFLRNFPPDLKQWFCFIFLILSTAIVKVEHQKKKKKTYILILKLWRHWFVETKYLNCWIFRVIQHLSICNLDNHFYCCD